MQLPLWIISAACAATAGVAILADRRQQRRTDADRVSLLPWPLVLVIALIAAAVCAALAIKRS